MFLRRLDPNKPNDEAMLKIAFEWETENIPLWWADAQRIFGVDTWEESLARSRRPDQMDIAVLSRDAIYSGLITLVMVAPKIYEFFFSAPRQSDAELLSLACFQVGKQLLIDDQMADQLISWVCSRHRGALKVNTECGMERDGLSMFKGRSHGRPLEWFRMRLTRERLLRLIDEQEEKNATDRDDSVRSNRDDERGELDSESVRLHDSARHAGRSGVAGMAPAG